MTIMTHDCKEKPYLARLIFIHFFIWFFSLNKFTITYNWSTFNPALWETIIIFLNQHANESKKH